MDNSEPDLDCNFVGLDNRIGGEMSARELWEHGHRNVLYVARPINSASLEERCSSFVDFYRTNGGKCTVVNWGDDAGFVGNLQKQVRKQKATALAVCNDLNALLVLQKFQEIGVEIPDELSLIGFDGISATGYSSVSLSTIRQPFERIGFLVASVIDEQWNSPQQPTQCKLLQPTLLRRHSVRMID